MRGVGRGRPGLRGRVQEGRVLDGVLTDVRAEQGRVLVLRGEAGVGKTALLDHLQHQATGCRVVRAAGVEAEGELAYAGLHQLCGPLLGDVAHLPDPQRAALGTVFGLDRGEPPDRFLVGLALLGLLSAVADERPLVCLVDDGQWLDRASRQALAFVARRLLAEPLALVFAVREPSDEQELAGLPELAVRGLGDDDAGALLDSVVPGRMDERVRDRIVAETRGNARDDDHGRDRGGPDDPESGAQLRTASPGQHALPWCICPGPSAERAWARQQFCPLKVVICGPGH